MEIQKFCTNQNMLGAELKKIIDNYLKNQISNEELILFIKEIVEFNANKFYSSNKIAEKVKRQLGKKRLEIVTKILELKII